MASLTDLVAPPVAEPIGLAGALAAPSSVTAPEVEARVEVFHDADAFERVEAAWRRLAGESADAQPFLDFDWARTWWDCFGAGRRLWIVLVSAGGRPLLLAPLALGTGRLCGLRVRQLELFHNAHVPRADLLVARHAGGAYAALWRHLHDSARQKHWDVLRLAEVPAGSDTLARLPALGRRAGFHVGVWPSQVSPYVPLDGAWERYSQSLDAKFRSNLRNRFRRLERLGPVTLETVTGGPDLDLALEDGLRLEAAAWKERAGTAIRCRRDTEMFYRRLAHVAAAQDGLRLHFLRVGARRVAFEYNLCHARRLHVLKLGYDPAFARFSPQNLLCARVLADAFGRGLREYDFHGADEPWKREWARRTRAHAWLFVLRPELRLRLAHTAKFRLLPRLRRRSLYRALHAWFFGLR